jgi:hypothetical protein
VISRALILALAAMMAAGLGNGWAQSAAPVGQPQVSTTGLSGVCGFSSASTNVKPTSGSYLEPRAIVGTITFDTSGNASLTGTENKHGVVSAISYTGTYAVGSDGRTGTLNLLSTGNGFTAQFEIVNGGTELRFMNTGPIDPATGIVDEVLIGICQF